MADPELYQQFKGHKDGITRVHFCPHKKRVVSSSMDQSIMLWNFNTDTKVIVFIDYAMTNILLQYSGL